ncbi:MAG: hypothetical protein NT120_00455 [Candidatus Aenigmarchaeota archaeon]|nr:hypothetical protein [Candidatus Aenigmarchaeota archaeon]
MTMRTVAFGVNGPSLFGAALITTTSLIMSMGTIGFCIDATGLFRSTSPTTASLIMSMRAGSHLFLLLFVIG